MLMEMNKRAYWH